MADYQAAISNCIREYGHMPHVLVMTMVNVINAAVENERARLRAEIMSDAKVCQRCHQACRECEAAIEAEQVAIRAAQASMMPTVPGMTPELIAALRQLGVVIPGAATTTLSAAPVADVTPTLTPRQAAQRARREKEKAAKVEQG